MDRSTLTQLLSAVQQSEVSVEEALSHLQQLPFSDLPEARLDHHRALRRGFPEVIYGEKKTPEQVATLFKALKQKHSTVLCTRIRDDHAQATLEQTPEAIYHKQARLLFYAPPEIANRGRGKILVICAGTADLPIAEEALWTTRLMGNEVELLTDVGVAGLHRTLREIPRIRQASVVIVVAGMEGALPSVIGGLTDRPVIAVPTSVGYGTSQGGWAALLGMLSSCTAGITVVNIDNGFGAGYAAALMNRSHTEEAQAPLISIQTERFQTSSL